MWQYVAMKKISLTKILVSNWDDIQAKLSSGMLLIDVFSSLEKKYNIERANTTWYTTYNRLVKKQEKNHIVQYNNVSAVPAVKPKSRKSTEWSADSKSGENPILAKLQKKK